MSTVYNDEITYKKPVRFEGTVEFAGGSEPEFSLANIDSLDISGNVIAAGSGQFGTDVSVGDDLTVTDDLTVGGDVVLGGELTLGGAAQFAGNVTLSTGDLTVG